MGRRVLTIPNNISFDAVYISKPNYAVAFLPTKWYFH